MRGRATVHLFSSNACLTICVSAKRQSITMHMLLISHEAMQLRVYTFAYICVELLESLLIKTVAMGTFIVQWKPMCVCVWTSLCAHAPHSLFTLRLLCAIWPPGYIKITL